MVLFIPRPWRRRKQKWFTGVTGIPVLPAASDMTSRTLWSQWIYLFKCSGKAKRSSWRYRDIKATSAVPKLLTFLESRICDLLSPAQVGYLESQLTLSCPSQKTAWVWTLPKARHANKEPEICAHFKILESSYKEEYIFSPFWLVQEQSTHKSNHRD